VPDKRTGNSRSAKKPFFFFPGKVITSNKRVTDLQSCPKCGTEAKPGNKFCGRCGAVLAPEADGTEPLPVPVQAGPVSYATGTTTPVSPRKRLVIAGLAVMLLLGVIAALLLLTGTGLYPAAGTINQSASTGGSYVVVGTEEPGPATTVQTLVPATFVSTTLTTRPTTLPVTKPVICASDLVQCNGTCVNLKTDSNYCGSCSTRCAIYQTCTNGQCRLTCSAGRTSCQDGCFDLMTSASHCGDCLNSCPTGLYCYNGQCMGSGQ
jgi:hypothetical protein